MMKILTSKKVKYSDFVMTEWGLAQAVGMDNRNGRVIIQLEGKRGFLVLPEYLEI